jgi:hypothetical protein
VAEDTPNQEEGKPAEQGDAELEAAASDTGGEVKAAEEAETEDDGAEDHASEAASSHSPSAPPAEAIQGP